MRTLLLICLAGLCQPLAAADLYKWTDEKGRVHYSDKPPPKGVAAENRPLPSEPDSAAAKEEEVVPVSESCLRARTALDQLIQNSNVAMDLDGDGKPETLDEAARQKQITAMRETVAQRCTPPAPKPAEDKPAPAPAPPPTPGG